MNQYMHANVCLDLVVILVLFVLETIWEICSKWGVM